jgi:hypothetical protein
MNMSEKSDLQNALSDLLKLSTLDKMTFSVVQTENNICIHSKTHNVLYLILFILYFLLPIMIVGESLKLLVSFILVYYSFFVLFLLNTTKMSHSILIDQSKQMVYIKNNNWLGKIIRKPVKISFSEVNDFLIEYRKIKGTSRRINRIYIETVHLKKISLIDVATEGPSLHNGRKFIEILSVLINLQK